MHDDHFPPDARDDEWLESVGRKNWVVLTKDRRIRYRKLERDALLRNGVRAFVLTAGDITGEEMAWLFVKALPRLQRLLTRIRRPFIAAISRAGAPRMIVEGS